MRKFFKIEKSLFKRSIQLFYSLVKPKSANEDLQRKEFILNVLLVGSLLLIAITTIVGLYGHFKFNTEFKGSPFLINLSILIYFFLLYLFSRFGYQRFSSYGLILVYLFSAGFVVVNWGIDVPQALLTFAVVIVLSGIIISVGVAAVITALSSVFLMSFAYLHLHGFVPVDSYWRGDSAKVGDSIVFSVSLVVILLVTWLSNREIDRSLSRARNSEKELEKERDLLEIRVEQRTEELKKAQLEKAVQLYRFAEFGRMTSGLFHDLVNPLTSVSMNLENLRKKEFEEIIKKDIKLAISGINQMKLYVKGAKKQIQKQEINVLFSPIEEILLALQILSFKARKEKVKLKFEAPEYSIKTYGNSIKFYRLIIGIVSNAIDSFDGLDRDQKNRLVRVFIELRNGDIKIRIKDFGIGIVSDNLKNIFDPFYTTKNIEKGTGIGLSICKEIVEKNFKGLIEVESKPNQGAQFTITIPLVLEKNN